MDSELLVERQRTHGGSPHDPSDCHRHRTPCPAHRQRCRPQPDLLPRGARLSAHRKRCPTVRASVSNEASTVDADTVRCTRSMTDSCLLWFACRPGPPGAGSTLGRGRREDAQAGNRRPVNSGTAGGWGTGGPGSTRPASPRSTAGFVRSRQWLCSLPTSLRSELHVGQRRQLSHKRSSLLKKSEPRSALAPMPVTVPRFDQDCASQGTDLRAQTLLKSLLEKFFNKLDRF